MRAPSLYLRSLLRVGTSVLFLFSTSVACHSGFAAESASTGAVFGVVSNEITGDPLWNATVSVEGAPWSTATERDGTYLLTGVPSGAQTLVASHLDLETQEHVVNVAPGRMTERDFVLTPGIHKMSPYVITGTREHQSMAMQQQRMAPNVKLVAAIDAFGNPAANPGELVQRLPEVTTEIIGSEVRGLFIRGMDPTFSVLQVDGYQMASSRGTGGSREFQIEQMGTGNLAAVELIKAPRPEDDANAIAGFVNLITKRGFDVAGRKLDLTLGTLWRRRESAANPFQDDPALDHVAVSYADKFSVAHGENNLGITFSAARQCSATTQDEVGAGMIVFDALYPVWFPTPDAAPLTGIFGTGDFFYKAVATNVGLDVDYRLGPASYAYLRSTYHSNNQYQRLYRWDIRTPRRASGITADSTSEFSQAVPNPGSYASTYSSLYDKESKNYSINPGVSARLFDDTVTFDASVFYSYANIKYPAFGTVTSTTQAIAPGGVGWSLDYRGQDARYPILAQTSGPSVFDADSYTPTRYQKIIWATPVTLLSGRIDFRKDLNAAFPAFIKVGAKYSAQTQQPTRDSELRTWVGAAGISPYAAPSYRQGNGHYGPFPFVEFPGANGSRDILRSTNFVISDRDAYDNLMQSTASDGKFRETITAGYVEGQISLGPVQMLGGVRVEQTDTTVTGYIQDNNPELFFDDSLSRQQNLARAAARFGRGPITTRGRYAKIHPGIHLTCRSPHDAVVRLSYNRSISRPNITALLASTSVSYADPEAPPTLRSGNADLRPFTSDNIEFSLEKYWKSAGKLSIGVFYKDITDYYARFVGVVPEGPDNGFGGQFAGYAWSRWMNTGDAWMRGVNVDYSQQFDFLPGPWKNLGVLANFTWLSAKGTLAPGEAATVSTLPGMAPQSGNFGVAYVSPRLQLRLLANYRGPHIMRDGLLSPSDPPANNNATWLSSRTMLDFKSQFRVNDRIEFHLDIYNLTNEPTNEMRTESGRPAFTMWQGTGFSSGVKVRW